MLFSLFWMRQRETPFVSLFLCEEGAHACVGEDLEQQRMGGLAVQDDHLGDAPVHGLHNAKLCPNEQALVVGSKLMSQVVINALAALNQGVDFNKKD